jgi:hypothetical protein
LAVHIVANKKQEARNLDMPMHLVQEDSFLWPAACIGSANSTTRKSTRISSVNRRTQRIPF